MSPYEQMRADQHEDITLAADHALEAFLAEVDPYTALLDLIPTTEIERRHLHNTRKTAA